MWIPNLHGSRIFSDDKGEGVIYDKDPDVRVRVTQYDIPKPILGKRSEYSKEVLWEEN